MEREMELRGSSRVKHARAMGSKERTRNRESMRIWELMGETERDRARESPENRQRDREQRPSEGTRGDGKEGEELGAGCKGGYER